MKKIIVNVLAFIGACIIAGVLYWTGFYHGLHQQVDYFHGKCKQTSLLVFEGDEVTYLCTPPPKKQQGPSLKYGSYKGEDT